MKRLERTTVQLTEAKRLAAFGDVPHGRLALLLLDNAAETLLTRAADDALIWADYFGDLLWSLRAAKAEWPRAKSMEEELRPKTVSKSARRRIEREFNSLVDYVFQQEKCKLDPAYAPCLKILHRYRNAAYHHDLVRADVLLPTVQIYFFLCCELLKEYEPFASPIDVAPPGVVEVFDGNLPASGNFYPVGYSASHLAKLVADRFLAQMHLDHGEVVTALSQHLVGRLDALEDDLDRIAEMFPPSSRDLTLRVVQLAPTDREDFDRDPGPDFWTRPVPVTQEVVDGWRADAERLDLVSVAHKALLTFGEIEEPLAVVEAPVKRFLTEIDREIQRRIDEARGK